jgi:protein involved in polysaccharide export with SLBB domain
MFLSPARQAIAYGIAAVMACGTAFAQFQSQRQDDLGIMSAPSQTGSGMNAPVQQVSPLPTAPVQAPTITNNPDYPRQPIFVPAPYTAPQLQQQPQGRQQQAPAGPRTSASEQRGRGAFTAPGVTREVTNERNEFQDFIWASTGQVLPVYGQNLFEAPSTFAPVENVPVTPDYIVGPGDELLVRAWGQIDIDYRAPVDRTGMINIPRVGSIPVAGVPYKDITSHVRTAIARNFKNFELQVTMGQLRSVQIFVVGYARRPGAYTVSSLSTLVNAVFAAGGPSPQGSMRTIQLKRGASIVTELDLYELLLNGDKSKDVPLLPGDVIYFGPIGPLAAVAGSVNNAAIYELKGQTNLGRLLDYAGGLTTTAQTQRATLERIDERKTRTVDQLALDYDGLKRPAKDGDLLSVLAILPRFENAVTLRGNVAEPLRFPYKSGMRIRDLIPEKEALITPDYYKRQNQAVRVETVGQGRLAADVRRLSDEINWDYAVIERLNPGDLTTSLIPFNLGRAVLENDASQNLALKPGDVVTVFSKTDVGAPAERRARVVTLEGEFNNAGVYQAQSGETLRQLVARVGGLTPQAYIFGSEFTRESTRKNQEERLKQALVQYEQDLQRAAAARARNVTNAEEAASLKAEADAQQATLTRVRTLHPTGRIVLELPESAQIADLPEIALEDGDHFVIPQRPSMVSVFGTVFNESSFLYRDDKSVSDYLTQAGGPRREADRGSIYLLRADGSVISKRGSGFLLSSLDSFHPMPGDAIVVPEDLTRTTLTKDLKDWTQIFYQFGLGAAALQVIRNR